MEKDLFSINELIEWYKTNASINISSDFFVYMITKGVLVPEEKSLYSLSALNELLLKKENNEFIKVYGKYQLKENRENFISTFHAQQTHTKKNYKIASLDGKNFKLIKL